MMTFSLGAPSPGLPYVHEVPAFATFCRISMPAVIVPNGVYCAGRAVFLYTRKNWLPFVPDPPEPVPLLAIATVPALYVAPTRFSLSNWYPGPPVPGELLVCAQVSLSAAFANGSPHCRTKIPLVVTRWHWLAFQKSAEARWTNEFTVQVALEFSSA